MARRPPTEELERRRALVPAVSYPDDLPITGHREMLLGTIADHQVVVVAGETGSGKSTQLPKLCLELGRGVDGLIGHTQPRRVAARTIAERVADELGCPLGTAVGYSVRFTDRVGPDTFIKVMTDGILLAEIQRDRLLRRYDTIIIDEAHERSLNIDFLLGYLTHLLPQRPDLKLIVTSATLDTERFSQHFGGAPVIEVSGRSYPVEVRYRPFGEEPDDDRDQVGAIADAVDELSGEGPGDILVFLSGEREIHDVADHLRRSISDGSGPRHTEVLPLYARMSAAEQHRVFEPHTGRRVILSTNIAETSITVPGVRYVIDAGTARISRYNRRLKVQRLPIEAVSQASANQRAGRCGRVAPGICIRLYGEQDFAQRPTFTEPEILRTNLASVILQMTALGLGDVASFPFVEPPDARSITDGINLLGELAAFEPLHDERSNAQRRLSKLGRRLAQLPIDPRLGRMVLEADRLGCAHEVMVIAAVLSIQDPRERPAEQLDAANAAHQRFVGDDGSDFMAFVRLWDHLRARQRELTGNQFRRLCRTEFLNYLRVREWEDLFSQLRQITSQLGIRLNTTPAHPDHVHQALLSGLLSQIGMREGESKEFRGPRNAKFMVGRGSAQAKRPARWVMAAELVETNRLWARVAARIQPEWAERLGAHLVKRSYDEPQWEPDSGTATVLERVSLYGLPIVSGRRMLLSRIDADLARRLFIRHALVLGDWETDLAFVQHNREVLDDVKAIAERIRRPDLVPSDDDVEDFYAARIPTDITSTRHFERWWRDTRKQQPTLLHLTRDELLHGHVHALDDFPERWEAHEPALPLDYSFDPAHSDVGVTVRIPLMVLNQIEPEPFEWLVPGLREELVQTCFKTLPKDIRRELIPAATHIASAVRALDQTEAQQAGRSFTDALAEALSASSGQRIRASDLDLSAVPDHLRVIFAVDDADGHEIARGRNLRELQSHLRSRVRSEISRLAGGIEQDNLTDWTVGAIAPVIEVELDGHVARGYPALIDDGSRVHLRLLTTAPARDRAMRKGVRRLLLLTVPLPRKACAQVLDNPSRLALARLGWGSAVDLVDDCIFAAVDHLLTGFELPHDEAGYRALERRVAAALPTLAVSLMQRAARAVVTAARVADHVDRLGAERLAGSVADVDRQLRFLVHPGFVSEAGMHWAEQTERFAAGLEYRVSKLRERPDRDLHLTQRVLGLEQRFARQLAMPEAQHLRWLVQELRVSLFAQHLGTSEPVSEQRLISELSRIDGRP
jgi:ATP-dependent helicase HrpA